MGVKDFVLYEDLVVGNNGIVNSAYINVQDSVSISNGGIINSDFFIDDALCVYVQNSGTINGEFHVMSDSNLIQVIQSADDITHLDVDINFSVLVQNANNLALTDVFDIGMGADKITLDNSTLVLNSTPRRRLNSEPREIEIIGDVIFKLDSVDGLDYSVPAMHNVSVAGHVVFDVANINPLYKIIADVDGGDLYMKSVRETDYALIFKNDMGQFLNDLRCTRPDDKLLIAMDSASDIGTINSIMTDSVRLNPIKLMAPIRRMHMLDALGGWRYSDMNSANATVDVIFSDDASMYRANFAVARTTTRNIYAAIGGYIGAFDVSDNINDFSGHVYGANIMTRFDDGLIVGNLSAGISRADFITGPVFNSASVVNDPNGMSGYAAADIGAYLLRDYDFTIVPFAGVVSDYASVLNDDVAFAANCGIEINFAEHEFDILYDYGLRGNVLTDGALYVGGFIKFSAPDDDIGGELNTAIIHDENGTGYKISISANMPF